MLTEIREESRTLQCIRKDFYVGKRYFGCEVDTGIGEAIALIGTDFPGMPSGVEAPKAATFHVIRKPGGKGAFDKVVIEYRTSMIGKGLIYVDEPMQPQRLLYDDTVDPSPTNRTVEGPETRIVGGRQDLYEWVVVQGSNIVNKNDYTFQVVTAYAHANVASVVEKMMALDGRTVNRDEFTHFFLADAHKVGWLGSRRKYDRADEATFVFKLRYKKDGYGADCKSRPGVWGIRREDVLNPDGTPVNAGVVFREIAGYHQGYEKNAAGAVIAATDVTHNLYYEDAGKMSFIDALEML